VSAALDSNRLGIIATDYLPCSALSGGSRLQPTICCSALHSIWRDLADSRLLRFTLIGDTTLNPPVCYTALCLARIQPTLCSVCSTLLCPLVLCPLVQHHNRLSAALRCAALHCIWRDYSLLCVTLYSIRRYSTICCAPLHSIWRGFN
jgi:hypothetical protein